MYSVYNELSLSRDNNDQVTSRHYATYRTHNCRDRRQATRDSGGPSQSPHCHFTSSRTPCRQQASTVKEVAVNSSTPPTSSSESVRWPNFQRRCCFSSCACLCCHVGGLVVASEARRPLITVDPALTSTPHAVYCRTNVLSIRNNSSSCKPNCS